MSSKKTGAISLLLQSMMVNDDREVRKLLERFLHIKVKFVTYDENHFKIYTFGIESKGPDDQIYSENPILYDLVPRAFSILTLISEEGEKIVATLCGLRKFNGVTSSDDDSSSITDSASQQKLRELFDTNELRVFESTKANGKNAVATLYIESITKKIYVLCGSKNAHFLSIYDGGRLNVLTHITESREIVVPNSISGNIIKNIELLLPKILSSEECVNFFRNHTLCGELEDGEHFCAGKYIEYSPSPLNKEDVGELIPRVTFFSASPVGKMGVPIPNDEFNSFCDKFSIHRCETKEIDVSKFTSFDEMISSIAISVRCGVEEGSVIYFYSTSDGEQYTKLMKLKTSRYILFRTMRTLLLSFQRSGKSNIFDIFKRIRDRKDYHLLNDKASFLAGKKLIDFTKYLADSNTPFAHLGCCEDGEEGGEQFGFYRIWQKFLDTCGEECDLLFEEKDFGEFNTRIFDECVQSFVESERGRKKFLVLMQGLQGSGKTTLSTALVEWLNSIGRGAILIEQDSSKKCKGLTIAKVIFSLLKENIEFVFLGRMNRNPGEYSQFTNTCKIMGCGFFFLSPKITGKEEIESYIDVCRRRVLSRTDESEHSFRVGVVGESVIQEQFRFNLANFDKPRGLMLVREEKNGGFQYPFFSEDGRVLGVEEQLSAVKPLFENDGRVEKLSTPQNCVSGFILSYDSEILLEEKMAPYRNHLSEGVQYFEHHHMTVGIPFLENYDVQNHSFPRGLKMELRVVEILKYRDFLTLRVDFDPSKITTGLPHITYAIPSGRNPRDSLDLLNGKIREVEKVLLESPIVLEGCFSLL